MTVVCPMVVCPVLTIVGSMAMAGMRPSVRTGDGGWMGQGDIATVAGHRHNGDERRDKRGRRLDKGRRKGIPWPFVPTVRWSP